MSLQIGEWEKAQEEGCYEAFVSFEEGLPKILLLRVVSDINDKFEAVIRDKQTGIMVASTGRKYTLKEAKKRAIKLLQKYFIVKVQECEYF